MKKLLYLVHRLPYPPNKGDKISSFNLLRYFAERYQVYLGCFIDSDEDWQYADTVRGFCADVCLVKLDPKRAKLTSSIGLLSGEPLTLPYYRSATLRAWVEKTLTEVKPDAVLVYSGALAQYLERPLRERGDAAPRTVLTFDDVDSEKWRQYAPDKRWPMNWVYRREADRLLAFERRLAAAADACVFISPAEAELFRGLAPEVADKVHARKQGVDSNRFDPDRAYQNPYPDDVEALVFTGLMDYYPNIEAVSWFADRVLPSVREQRPRATFYIVGMNPAAAVRKLGERPGIVVTGKVDEVQPFLAFAAAVVAPLRIARGIQNKVLEALAMARPVIATRAAMSGIHDDTAARARVVDDDDAEAMARALIERLAAGRSRDDAARASVLQHYNWDTNLRQMETLLSGETAR